MKYKKVNEYVAKKLKYSNGKKKIHSVSLDVGVALKTKKLLENFNESFSGLIDGLLDEWCQSQEEQNTLMFQSIKKRNISDDETTPKIKETMAEMQKQILELSAKLKKS